MSRGLRVITSLRAAIRIPTWTAGISPSPCPGHGAWKIDFDSGEADALNALTTDNRRLIPQET